MSNILYVIDTSALVNMGIDYRYSILPSLWDRDMVNLISEGRLIAPVQVLPELKRKDDDVSKWAEKHSDKLFQLTPDVIQKAFEITQTPEFQGLVDKNIPGEQADPFVCAMGYCQKNSTLPIFDDVFVVTDEKMRGNVVRIPFVCRKLGVRYCRFIDMVASEGWSYR